MLSYGVIGVVSASLDATVFWLLVSFRETPPQVANAIGICCGITLSFLLNRAFTFRVRDRAGQRFATFLAVGLGGLVLSALVLQLGMQFGLRIMEAKLLSVALVAATQFILNRTITFRA